MLYETVIEAVSTFSVSDRTKVSFHVLFPPNNFMKFHVIFTRISRKKRKRFAFAITSLGFGNPFALMIFL